MTKECSNTCHYSNSSVLGDPLWLTIWPRLQAPNMSKRQLLSWSKIPIQGVKRQGYPQEREDGEKNRLPTNDLFSCFRIVRRNLLILPNLSSTNLVHPMIPSYCSRDHKLSLKISNSSSF